MKGGGGEVEKRKDQGEESSSNRDEARSPPRYINFHRSRSLRAFFTITHPFYPRLPILYNSRDVPRNNNFSPSLQNSLSLISRNETSNFFRPLHLLSLSVPAETADKMASRDVSFVSFVLVSPPTVCKISLRVLSACSPHLPLQQGNRETSPATDSFPLRTTPSADKTSRITIFSTGIDRRCTLAKVSLRFKHFSTLSSSPRFFLYIADILQS